MILEKLAIDIRIAAMASSDELKFQRMIGASEREAFDGSYAILDEVLTLSSSPERDYVWQMPRIVTGRR